MMRIAVWSTAIVAIAGAITPVAVCAQMAGSAAHAAAPVQPVPQASLAIARQIVDIAYPPAERPALFAGVTANMLQQMKGTMLPHISDAGLRQLLTAKLDTIPARLAPVTARHIPAFMDAYAHAYAREFTLEELRQVLAFVSTPAGGHYVSRAPKLLGDPDVAAANRAYFADIRPLQQAMMSEVQRDVTAYVQKHPGAAPR